MTLILYVFIIKKERNASGFQTVLLHLSLELRINLNLCDLSAFLIEEKNLQVICLKISNKLWKDFYLKRNPEKIFNIEPITSISNENFQKCPYSCYCSCYLINRNSVLIDFDTLWTQHWLFSSVLICCL